MMITLNLTGMEMSVMNVSNIFKINGCVGMVMIAQKNNEIEMREFNRGWLLC